MEERMVDDEYGRGIRLKKTKDGHVDVVDEQADEAVDVETDVADEEEVEVTFPNFDDLEFDDEEEDDEDLATLSPEEALQLRQQKKVRAEAMRTEYERLCAEGFALLETDSFRSAELKFEQALRLDKEATDASVGYWRAKTGNFADPDVLVGEYAEASIESLEYDLGMEAVERIKKEYQPTFRAKYKQLCEEETPLIEQIEQKKAHRKQVLKGRLKTWTIALLCVTLPMLALGILTAVIGMKNFTVRDNQYVLPTVLLGVATFACFIAFIIVANKFINVLRMLGANEKLESTADGRRLVEIRDYKQIYEGLLLATEELLEEETGTESPEIE